MKRKILPMLIIMIAAICLAFSFAACFQQEDIYGRWIAEKQIMQVGDRSTEGESNFTITINEDETLTAIKYPDIYTSVKGTGTWTEENGVYQIHITYEDNSTANFSGTINKQHLTIETSNSQWSIKITYIMKKSN